MALELLKTDAEHAAALARVDELMDAEPGTDKMRELELWVHLIDRYEEEHTPIPLPDPVAAIRFEMDQRGLKQKDLVPYFGSAAKVSEVLGGKRSLSLAMIRALHAGLGIPAEVLIGEPDPVRATAELA